MAKLFHIRAFRMNEAVAQLSLALLLLVASAFAMADTGLTPYSAEYTTKVKGFTLKLKRELRQGSDGEYILTNSGKKLVLGFQEEARFRVEDSRVVPSSYVYQGTGLMNRRREVQFTPGSDVVRSLYKDNWYDLPYEHGTLDRMSQQEQTRLSLLNDPTPAEDTSMKVADRKDIKTYRMQFVVEEELDTPLGRVTALKFRRLRDDPDRVSEFWLAPDWDFMMVKTRHVEKGSEAIAVLTAATLDGAELQGR